MFSIFGNDNPFLANFVPSTVHAPVQPVPAPVQESPPADPVSQKYDPSSALGRALAAVQAGAGNVGALDVLNPVQAASRFGAGVGAASGVNPLDALQVLDVPRDVVLSPFGGAAAADTAFERGHQAAMDNPLSRGMLQGIPGGRLLENPTIAKMAFQTVTDPLTLIGGPGKALGQGAVKAGVTGPLATAAKGLVAADDAISNALGAVAHEIVRGGQAALAPVNDLLALLWRLIERRASIRAADR